MKLIADGTGPEFKHMVRISHIGEVGTEVQLADIECQGIGVQLVGRAFYLVIVVVAAGPL